jgi:molecular chaperone GrpE
MRVTKIKSKQKEMLQEDENLIEDAENSKSQDINGAETSENNMDPEANTLVSELEEKLKKKEQECEEYLDMLKRTKAEFDNYRKRTVKERDTVYIDGFAEGIKQILPVVDNLERAVTFTNTENAEASDSLLKGVEMVLKMFKDTLAKNDVEELPSAGSSFDPNFHNAVMHVVDENLEENVVVEVFEKGYKYKDKIVRHSMVKVAN